MHRRPLPQKKIFAKLENSSCMIENPSLYYRLARGSGSVGRAQPCQGWGRGFEPRLPLHRLNRAGLKTSALFLRPRRCNGWRRGQAVRQRPAKPLSPVRFRSSPPTSPLPVFRTPLRGFTRATPLPRLSRARMPSSQSSESRFSAIIGRDWKFCRKRHTGAPCGLQNLYDRASFIGIISRQDA